MFTRVFVTVDTEGYIINYSEATFDTKELADACTIPENHIELDYVISSVDQTVYPKDLEDADMFFDPNYGKTSVSKTRFNIHRKRYETFKVYNK